jgi:hypothetical protein
MYRCDNKQVKEGMRVSSMNLACFRFDGMVARGRCAVEVDVEGWGGLL